MGPEWEIIATRKSIKKLYDINHRSCMELRITDFDGKMEPVLSRTADILESIECELGILLADEESSPE
jgi:hypothetical protein